MRLIGTLIVLILSVTSSAFSQAVFLDKGQSGFAMSAGADYMTYERGLSSTGSATASIKGISGGKYEAGLVFSFGNRRHGRLYTHFSIGVETEVLFVRESVSGFPVTLGFAAMVQATDPSGRADIYLNYSLGPVVYKRLSLSEKKTLMPFIRLQFLPRYGYVGSLGVGLPLALRFGGRGQLILGPELCHTSMPNYANVMTLSFRVTFCSR